MTYSPFCNLIGLQYALQREQLALDQTLSARARGCGYARLLSADATSGSTAVMEFAASGKERRAGEVMGTVKGGLTWAAGASTGRQDSLFSHLLLRPGA